MKRNAKHRIIFWSILLGVLVLTLLYFLIGNWVNQRDQNVLPPVTQPTEYTQYRPTEESVPSQTAVQETLAPETQPEVTAAPEPTADPTLPTVVVPEIPVEIPEDGDAVVYHPGDITELDIEWGVGSITIVPAQTAQIRVYEEGAPNNPYVMRHTLKGSKLSIDFCKDQEYLFSMGIDRDMKKDLIILVPYGWSCQELDIDAASTDVEISDLTVGELDFDGASGKCTLNNCNVNELDMDTASGDIQFTGSLNQLDFDAASANITAVLTNTPSRLKMDTMSGEMDITLPKDAGFSLKMDGLSAHFSTDFDTTLKNGEYVSGNGHCRISLNTLSGDVIIRKAG